MARTQSSALTEIFKAYKARHTLDVYLSNGSELHLSRGRVERVVKGQNVLYDNWIRSIGSLRSTIDNATDRLSVTLQNVNSQIGFKLASSLRLLDYAVCDYGKQYQSIRNSALIEDVPGVFRGVLADAEVDEEFARFDLVVDYDSLGRLIAARGLSPRCRAGYKNGIECTTNSPSPTCPKTRAACERRGKPWEFLGWEFFEEPVSSLPGTGTNSGGIGNGNGGGSCFSLDTKIWLPSRGEVRIGDLPAGRLSEPIKIVSFDETTGELCFDDEIEEVFEHEVTGCYTFEFENGSVNVTPEHRFFIGLNQWLAADCFRQGDASKAYLDHRSGWFDSKLLRIKWNSDRPIKVRNLHVRRNHTYFANRLAVHNAKEVIL